MGLKSWQKTVAQGVLAPVRVKKSANRLLLVIGYDNKKVKLPHNWVISLLTKPQVANQTHTHKKKTFLEKHLLTNQNS